MALQQRRPTREDLLAAAGKRIPDVVAPGLNVLFCGINPGLYSGATGHHFARPGNRFWPALHLAGFTPRVLHPSEKRELLKSGLGITNLVARSTAAADELTDEELSRAAGGSNARCDGCGRAWLPCSVSEPTARPSTVPALSWAAGRRR